MKKVLLALLLLLPGSVFAQQLVNCAPGVPCNAVTGPSFTGTGDPAWMAFGKINANFQAVPSITGSPVNGNLAKFSSASGLTNGNLSGDCTTSGALTVTCTNTNGTPIPNYPKSSAETTAGVTPSNLAKPYLDVVRYGADPTGVASSATAINNCNLVATVNGGRCIFEEGAYTIGATAITLQSNVVDDCQGTTITYTGTAYAFTTPTSGTTNYTGVANCTISLSSASGGALNLLSTYHSAFSALYITGTASSTNTVIFLGTNTTGTNNPSGNLNNVFNAFDSILIDYQVGTGMQVLGTDSNHVVTDNTFKHFQIEGGASGGATVAGIDFNQWCDTNLFTGHTLVRLNQTSPASAIGVVMGDGAGGGVYAETFQGLAVDVFGSPATDTRQGIVASNTLVKFIVIDLFEYGPTTGTGPMVNISQLVSSVVNQAPRSATNFQTYWLLGTNVGIGSQSNLAAGLTIQNIGQASGATQYDVFAQTPGFNTGSPSLVVGVGSQPSLAISGSAYNVAQVMGFQAATGSLGTNATATNAYSFYDAGQTMGSTANYGYYSAANTPAFDFYAAGTGGNVFNGGVQMGVPTGGNKGVGTLNIAGGLSGLYMNGTAIQATTPAWTAGFTSVGGNTSINASSNFTTNIGTGTTTSAVGLGGTANAVNVGAPLNLTTAGGITANSWTTNGLVLGGTAQTLTDGTGSGTIAQETAAALPIYTFNSTNASVTITNLSELYLPIPVATGNVTATNLWSLNSAGQIRSAGIVVGLAGATFSGGVASFNANSNFASNINTGTSTSNATVGGTSNITNIGGGLALTTAGAISHAAWTTSGLAIAGTAETLTDSSTVSGTITREAAAALPAYTIATTNTGVTITNLDELYLPAPVAGTNVTGTNKWSLDTGGGANIGGLTQLAAGTAAVEPLLMQSGTNLTTPAAGAVEYDGVVPYFTPTASSRGVLLTDAFEAITSAYTLTSQTAAQKLLNGTTNGTLTVPVGTFDFECQFSLSSLSATATFGFALGGTATFTQAWWATTDVPTGLATIGGASLSYNTAANTAISGVAASGFGVAEISGIIRVTVAGTIIPQVSMSVAAAAVVGANSFCRFRPIGAQAVVSVGNWS